MEAISAFLIVLAFIADPGGNNRAANSSSGMAGGIAPVLLLLLLDVALLLAVLVPPFVAAFVAPLVEGAPSLGSLDEVNANDRRLEEEVDVDDAGGIPRCVYCGNAPSVSGICI